MDVDQDSVPTVGDWVVARHGGGEGFFLGVIEEVNLDEKLAANSFTILYDLDESPRTDELGNKERDHETNVPLDRVVFVQRRGKKRKMV